MSGIGVYDWTSTQLITDVQAMLDDPEQTHGWIVVNADEVTRSAKRFDSRQNSSPDTRPKLIIGYDLPAGPRVDLIISKTVDPDPVIDDRTLIYTIAVTNASAVKAMNVSVTDNLPEEVTFTSASSECVLSNIDVLCTIGGFAAGASTALIVNVSINIGISGSFTNTVSVSTSTVDTNLVNNTAVFAITLTDTDNDGAPDFNDLDDDNDHMPDGFELKFGLNPKDDGDGGLDNDMDGFSNLDEYIADTNPTNSMSFFKVDAIAWTNSITMFYDSSTARVYTLEYIDDPISGTFTSFPDKRGIPGSGGTNSITDTNDAPMRYYRIGVEVP